MKHIPLLLRLAQDGRLQSLDIIIDKCLDVTAGSLPRTDVYKDGKDGILSGSLASYRND